MKLFVSYIFIWCAFVTATIAQDSTLVLSKNFQFKDGVYLSVQEFQNNQPSLTWEEVYAMVFSNPQNFMVQVQYIRRGRTDDAPFINLQEVWGICLGGIPYVRLEKGAVDKSLTVFAGLRLRGKICYFNYENEVVKELEMPVYNPGTDIVFRKATVERKQTVVHEKMLHFETGEIAPFDAAHFKAWIDDDPRLVKTLEAMSSEELKEKLFKCLLIYVDRNEVNIKNDLANKE